MIKAYSILGLAVVALMGFGLADDQVPEKKADGVSALGMISPQENDRRIARWLTVDNDSMLGCAQMAEDRTENGRVKEFAKTVIADHKRLQDRLIAFTNTTDTPVNSKPAASKVATLLKDEGRSRDNRLAFTPTDFLIVKETVCKDLRSKAEKEVKNLKGAEFDDAFLAHMVFGHEALISSIDAVKADATLQLQTTLDEFRQASIQHLNDVRKLHKERHPETAKR